MSLEERPEVRGEIHPCARSKQGRAALEWDRHFTGRLRCPRRQATPAIAARARAPINYAVQRSAADQGLWASSALAFPRRTTIRPPGKDRLDIPHRIAAA